MKFENYDAIDDITCNDACSNILYNIKLIFSKLWLSIKRSYHMFFIAFPLYIFSLFVIILLPEFHSNDIINMHNPWFTLYIISYISFFPLILWNIFIIDLYERTNKKITKKVKLLIKMWFFTLIVSLILFSFGWTILLNYDTRKNITDLKNQQTTCISNIFKYNITFDNCMNDDINCLYTLNNNTNILTNKKFTCDENTDIFCNLTIQKYNVTTDACNNVSDYCFDQLQKNINTYKDSIFVCV